MTFIFPLFFIIFLVISPVNATNDSTRISHIDIYGNRVTREKIIRMYLEIDSGSIVDSLVLQNAKKRLMKSNLFSKVSLFTITKNDGEHLYVIVTERFYLTPDAGGGYYRYKYGKEELWFRFNLSVDYKNFRGNAEKIKVAVGFWDWRSISLSWSKPFLPSKYYLIIGASSYFHPDLSKKIDHTQFSGNIIFGKELFGNSKIGLGFIPTHKKLTSLDNKPTLHASECFSILGWQTDFRNSFFNTAHGWYIYTDLWSNHLYHSKSPAYLQSNTEFKVFHRGVFKSNTIAWRLGATIRNKDAGSIHNLGLGGTKTVRGYAQPSIGGSINGNNSLLLSFEYRFPIFRLPTLSFPTLKFISSSFESIDIRVHGALIADYGRVGQTTADLLSVTSEHIESGTGLGAGIRILLPDLETSGSVDVVFAQDYRLPRGKIRFFSMPELHAYLNFPY